MNSVGSLLIDADFAAGTLADLRVRLERPPVTRLFVGQPPEAVVKTVPYLYTLCAQAQRAAAQAALAAAADTAPRTPDHAALWGEMLHEHLWRLLLDWPLALGLPQARDALVAWRANRAGDGLAAATEKALADTLLGVTSAAWQGEPTSASLAGRCLTTLGNGEKAHEFDLPPLSPAPWLAYWQGSAPRQPMAARPASVAAAYRQRLQETVLAARALGAGRPYPLATAGGNGCGIGQTLTARGVLTHGAMLAEGKVTAYRIWAPTDCHFADAGDLAALLDGGPWPGVDAARQAVEKGILALDPCLPYELKVSYA